MIDTLRQDHLKAYGYARETAPTLTRLAAEGARLDGLSPSSWTKPAVASLFTGLHPLRHQAVGLEDSLPQAALTLAERLRAHGYDTLGVTANGFSSARFAMDQGFRELVYLADVGHGSFADAGEVDQEVFARLSTLRPPYFLFVHYLDPHAPYDPPPWGAVRPGAQRARGVSIQDLEMETFFARPEGFLRQALDTYDGEIVRADAAAGRLLARLDEAGLSSGALTVALSDHGEEFQEHGRMGHGQTLYEESLRVPLIFHWPGRIPAGTRGGTVSLLDVLPTVLDLLGLPFEAQALDGRSVARGLVAGAPAAPDGRAFLLHLDVMRSHHLALRRGDDKLLLGRYPQHKELFDLARDPGERTNRLDAPSPPDEFAGLAGALAAEHARLLAQALPRVTAELSAPVRGDLAALGYVGGAPGGERRGIPARIHAPDPDPDGRLGWEEPRAFKACLDLATPGAADQLLGGWYAAQAEGRWSWPDAELLLARPSGTGPLRLRLRGLRREPAPARLRALADGLAVLDQDVPGGAFELAAPIAAGAQPAAAATLLHVRLERTPAYVPAESGGAGDDHRRLGLLLQQVCLEAAPRDRTGAERLLSLRR